MMIGRRAMLSGGIASLGATAVGGSRVAAGDAAKWQELGGQVKFEMRWAWDAYRARAWGKDEIKPVSGTSSSFPLKGHHLGLSLIEALDTLWVMGLDSRFADGVDWVKAELEFDIDGEVSVFETSIRLIGGLLSAHHACGDPVLLAKARDLADRLLPAFDTPTGFPYRFINLKTGARRDPATNPAEIGSFLPEWGTLSRLTGDPRYRDVTRHAMVELFAKRSRLDLLAVKIDALTGEWLDRRATVGSYADSYYEYLWDSWQLFGDAECRRMYEVCTAAILRHQQVWRNGRLWIADVDFETGVVASTEQDELASFYGGLLAQGGARREGAALTETWGALQDSFGVLPEGYDYASSKPTARGNALRPELVDAAFNLWLIDQSPRWRMIAERHFLEMTRWNKAPFGYTDLADVTATPKRQADHCPGYWWSEQMKYYYLMFSNTPRFDYTKNYLTTEGNVLLGFRSPLAN
jgi:mannosyl-oligosaccharide alpha-1,2-mannosidase